MEPFITGAEEFMRENEVFCVAKKDDKIALGTIHKGLVLVDCSTMQLKYFNENNGLRNKYGAFCLLRYNRKPLGRSG